MPKPKPGFVTELYVPRAQRVCPADDPEGWVADGWRAPDGVKREVKPVVSVPIPETRGRDPAAAAAAAAARARYDSFLVVGAAVDARFQASLNVPWKTHWFPGSIDAVHADGTFGVRYDDGDYEPAVKRRFIKLRRSDKKRGRTPENSTSDAGSHGWDDDIDDQDAAALEELGMDEIDALVGLDPTLSEEVERGVGLTPSPGYSRRPSRR